MFRFIDWLTWLPEPLEVQAHNQFAEWIEGKTMPYVTHIERIVQERREEIEKARQEGLREAIALGLELRFGKEGLRVLPRVEAVRDAGRLRELKEALLRVASLPELEALLEGR